MVMGNTFVSGRKGEMSSGEECLPIWSQYIQCILSFVSKCISPAWRCKCPLPEHQINPQSACSFECLTAISNGTFLHQTSSTQSFQSQLIEASSSLLLKPKTWIIHDSSVSHASFIGNPMNSTFKIYPESNKFLLPSLLPPGPSYCHSSPGCF